MDKDFSSKSQARSTENRSRNNVTNMTMIGSNLRDANSSIMSLSQNQTFDDVNTHHLAYHNDKYCSGNSRQLVFLKTT